MAKRKPVTIDLAARRGTPGEKWMDVAVVHGQSEGSPLLRDFVGSLPDLYDLDEQAELTAADLEIISRSLATLNLIRHGLGFPGVTVNPSRVHMIEDSVFARVCNVPDEACRAFWMYGHVYMREMPSPQVAVWLPHELAHVTAYWRQEMRLFRSKVALLDNQGRSGMARTKRGLVTGVGLDEAATEILAGLVREEHCRRLGFSEEEHDEVLQSWAYVPHVNLVCRLCERLVEQEPDAEPIDVLMQDYFGGTDSFLDAMEKIVPRDELLAVTDEIESAVAFMERHGLV